MAASFVTQGGTKAEARFRFERSTVEELNSLRVRAKTLSCTLSIDEEIQRQTEKVIKMANAELDLIEQNTSQSSVSKPVDKHEEKTAGQQYFPTSEPA